MHRNVTSPARMAHLDGLRGVAILSVLGFHYFTCFQSIVPYGGAWAEFPPFRWGHLGVHLFFAISGFVIAMTLERCTGLDDFAVRRFARLWPTMLLCSLLSYATLSLLPSPWPPKPADFLPSLSFIDGFVWNKLIPGLDAGWIDVAYCLGLWDTCPAAQLPVERQPTGQVSHKPRGRKPRRTPRRLFSARTLW